jgi:hypothetical protein
MVTIKVMSFPDLKRPCLVLQDNGRCTILGHFKSEKHADLFCRIVHSYTISREYAEKSLEDCMSELYE